MKALVFNNKITGFNNKGLSYEAPPAPPLPFPSDMHFVYLANDFDGSQIQNRAPNSDMGPYLKSGTVTKNGTGSNCYLSITKSAGNYLYIDLTDAQLNLMKGLSTAYTFYCRIYDEDNGMGGIFSWRHNDSSDYIFMIRSYQQQLQLHWSSGYNCGSNFSTTLNTVYKIRVTGNTLTAKNLTTGDVASSVYSGDNRQMGTRMTTFEASNNGEYYLDRVYALAGIARETTDEEDEQIKNYLMSQGV